MSIPHITAQQFDQEVTQASVPVVVDFYATWCPPCRMIAPVLEQLAQQYAGRVNVFKVNVDQEPVLAAQFNISSIPTLLFIHNGQIVDRVVGALPPASLAARFADLAAMASQSHA